MASQPTSAYALDHLPVTLLGLSPMLEGALAAHGITTVEALARISCISNAAQRDTLLKRIQQELSIRIGACAIDCPLYADGKPTLRIAATHFTFTATLITRNPLHCTCTYRWLDATLEGSLPFHLPTGTVGHRSVVYDSPAPSPTNPPAPQANPTLPPETVGHRSIVHDGTAPSPTNSPTPQANPALPPEVAACPIKHTTLSTRGQNALVRNNIRTVGELVSMTDWELLCLRNFGPKLLAEVRSFLADVAAELPTEVEEDSEQDQLIASLPELHAAWSVIEAMQLHYLDLPTRIKNALKRAEIFTLGQLLMMRKRDLNQIKNFGPTSVAFLETELRLIKPEAIRDQLATIRQQALNPENLLSSMDCLNPLLRRKLKLFRIIHLGHLCEYTTAQLLQNGFYLSEVKTLVALLTSYQLQFQGEQCDEGAIEAETTIRETPTPLEVREVRPQLNLEATLQHLLAALDPRQRVILQPRYGLDGSQGKTLQAVADIFGISRERVRQIETKALKKLCAPYYNKRLNPVYLVLEATLICENGIISTEQAKASLGPYTKDLVLTDSVLGFLFHLMPQVTHLKELGLLGLNQPPFAAWLPSVEKVCATFLRCLAEAYAPLGCADLLARCQQDQASGELFRTLPAPFVIACLNAHPELSVDAEGAYSLNRWANKRLDDIIIVLRQHGAPLHYAAIAERVNARLPEELQTSAHNVHAQMGRLTQLFVRVGNGIFGLTEWGLPQDRTVADAAYRILSATGRALDIEALTDRVLETWQVKRNSVRAAVELDPRFVAISPGRYWLTTTPAEQAEDTPPTNDDFATLFGDVLTRRRAELEQDRQSQDHADKLDALRRMGTDLFS